MLRSLAFLSLSLILSIGCDSSDDPGPEDTLEEVSLSETQCGLLVCTATEACCDFACVDPSTSAEHCGACGQSCGPDEACQDGLCRCGTQGELCGDAELCCDGDCHGPSSLEHCGACGKVCGSEERCLRGACLCLGSSGSVASCGDDETCCPGLEDPCADLSSDPQNCGACGLSCGSGEPCVDGMCVCGSATALGGVCAPGEACCGDPAQCQAAEGCVCGRSLCGAGQACCSGPQGGQLCASTWRDNDNCGACGVTCEGGELCRSGQCTCQNGRGDCNANAGDGCEAVFAVDRSNCGGCGQGCSPGEVCNGLGQCSATCARGFTLCDGVCVNLASSTLHCGACGNACPSGEVCNGAGACGVSCGVGFTECDGACVDLDRNRVHCGACGVSCEAGEVCDGQGVCALSCQSGYTNCGEECADLLWDRNHCGACQSPCAPGEVCDGQGACNTTCSQDQKLCDGWCVDIAENRNNCGDCGVSCPTGSVCRVGQCVRSCPAGQTLCEGVCVDAEFDEQHCGGCGVSCLNTELCVSGVCGLECAGRGLSECRGVCVETQTDSAHCGSCDRACATGAVCEDGACVDSGCASCSGYARVAVGARHTCALERGNPARVLCWGANDTLQLGAAALPFRVSPQEVPLPEEPVEIAVGVEHSCALGSSGQVYCWGARSQGQLGDGDTLSPSANPVLVLQDVGSRLALQGVVQLSAGAYHTCAVTRSRETYCWGANASGQLGDGTQTSRSSATRVELSPSDVLEIAAGFRHTCAVRGSGELWCWGDNAAGQLGTGSLGAPSLLPVRAGDFTAIGGTGSMATGVATGGAHTCVLARDLSTAARGTPDEWQVWCVGFHAYGQLGPATTQTEACVDPWLNLQKTCATSFVRVPSSGLESATPVQLSAGVAHTCVTSNDGRAWCWGGSATGQLGGACELNERLSCGYNCSALSGYGYPTVCKTQTSAPVAVAGLTDVVAIEAGWGSIQAETPGGGNVLQPDAHRAVARAHTCAVLSSGEVSCWGDAGWGQLGEGLSPTAPRKVLDRTGTPVKAEHLVSLSLRTCAVASSGPVQCWGRKVNQGPSDAFNVYRDDTRLASPEADATAGLSMLGMTGQSNLCALNAQGEGVCWGEQSRGIWGADGLLKDWEDGNGSISPNEAGLAPAQFDLVDSNGDGALSPEEIAVQREVAFVLDDVMAFGGTQQHIVALLSSGRARHVTVGFHDATSCPIPSSEFAACGEAGCVDTYSDPSHCGGCGQACGTGEVCTTPGTCASTCSGGTLCGGRCVDTQRDDAHCGGCDQSCAAGERCALGSCEALPRLTSISTSLDRVCGVTMGGGVACWSTGDPKDAYLLPREVAGLSSVVTVATGSKHACALHNDASVSCWGDGSLGQLGDGNGAGSPTPVVVSGLSATEIAAGEDHTCAVRLGGDVVCWGRNDDGRLGDGTFTQAQVPVALAGTDDFSRLACGSHHCCAVDAGDEVWCWGSPEDGVLGDGRLWSSTPQRIP